MKEDIITPPPFALNDRQLQMLAGLELPMWQRRQTETASAAFYYVVGDWLLELNQPWPVQAAPWLNDLAIALCEEQATSKTQVNQVTANNWAEQHRIKIVEYDIQQPLSTTAKQKLWAQLWQN